MLRLLQGDVGSGKTAVGAYALALAAGAGVQGALLAPTDLLARQHAVTLDDLLRPLGVAVELLTGSLAGPESRRSGSITTVASTPTSSACRRAKKWKFGPVMTIGGPNIESCTRNRVS